MSDDRQVWPMTEEHKTAAGLMGERRGETVILVPAPNCFQHTVKCSQCGQGAVWIKFEAQCEGCGQRYKRDMMMAKNAERVEEDGFEWCDKKPAPVDQINHPPHYNSGKIEVIEFIEDQELGYHLGNALKYICRAGLKSHKTYVQDLEKAIWYIKRRIELRKDNPCRPNEMPNENTVPVPGDRR